MYHLKGALTNDDRDSDGNGSGNVKKCSCITLVGTFFLSLHDDDTSRFVEDVKGRCFCSFPDL